MRTGILFLFVVSIQISALLRARWTEWKLVTTIPSLFTKKPVLDSYFGVLPIFFLTTTWTTAGFKRAARPLKPLSFLAASNGKDKAMIISIYKKQRIFTPFYDLLTFSFYH